MPPPPAQPLPRLALVGLPFPAALDVGLVAGMESHSGGGFRGGGSDVQLCVGPFTAAECCRATGTTEEKTETRKVVHSHVVVMSWQNWFWFQEPVP